VSYPFFAADKTLKTPVPSATTTTIQKSKTDNKNLKTSDNKLKNKISVKNQSLTTKTAQSKPDQSDDAVKNKHYPSFRLIIDARVEPVYYEFLNQIFLFGIGGNLSFGIQYKQFTFALEGADRYFSLNGYQPGNTFNGAFNIVNAYLAFYAEPVWFFEVSTGLGAGWYRSAVDYNQLGIIAMNQISGAAYLNFQFRFPFKYISLEQINRFDLFFDIEKPEPVMMPFYYGGIRLNFKPYYNWINLYIEAGGIPWYYKTELNDIQTGLLVWSAGIKFDMIFPDLPKRLKADYEGYRKNHDRTSDTVKVVKKTKEQLEYDQKVADADAIMTRIINSKKGDIILLPNIFFDDANLLLGEDYKILLNKFAAYLIENPTTVAIGGYSTYQGDPNSEIATSKKRATSIKDYLIAQGVSKDQLKILASGRVYSKDTPAKDQMIELKIIKR
jgi:outer membrane protein OmpA-like peptidoglycan-associated protein